MKKFILIIVAVFLLGCATGKGEVIQDPIFEENFIQYNEDGTKNYIMQDPIFPENYLIFPVGESLAPLNTIPENDPYLTPRRVKKYDSRADLTPKECD